MPRFILPYDEKQIADVEALTVDLRARLKSAEAELIAMQRANGSALADLKKWKAEKLTPATRLILQKLAEGDALEVYATWGKRSRTRYSLRDNAVIVTAASYDRLRIAEYIRVEKHSGYSRISTYIITDAGRKALEAVK